MYLHFGEAGLSETIGGLFVFCIQNKKVKMNANTSFLGSRQCIVSISAYQSEHCSCREEEINK